MKFYDTSKELIAGVKRKPTSVGERKKKYPWEDLPLGKSFIVEYDSGIKLESLKVLAWKTGQRLGKRFRVHDHGEKIGMEVARVSLDLNIKGDVTEINGIKIGLDGNFIESEGSKTDE